jgi:hypothetical protein
MTNTYIKIDVSKKRFRSFGQIWLSSSLGNKIPLFFKDKYKNVSFYWSM